MTKTRNNPLYANNVQTPEHDILHMSLFNRSFRSVTTIAQWIVGGHSAGGYAVHEALCDQTVTADAVVSFDPFYEPSFPCT